jgi:homoserine acetyltransferase
MTNEKAKTYFELITEDKEKVNAEMKKLEAKQAALQVESDILATRTELNKAISAYEAAKRQEPFSASRVLDAQKHC